MDSNSLKKRGRPVDQTKKAFYLKILLDHFANINKESSFASNAYFAQRFGKSIRQTKRIIAAFKKENLITTKIVRYHKDGQFKSHRIMKKIDPFTSVSEQEILPKTQDLFLKQKTQYINKKSNKLATEYPYVYKIEAKVKTEPKIKVQPDIQENTDPSSFLMGLMNDFVEPCPENNNAEPSDNLKGGNLDTFESRAKARMIADSKEGEEVSPEYAKARKEYYEDLEVRINYFGEEHAKKMGLIKTYEEHLAIEKEQEKDRKEYKDLMNKFTLPPSLCKPVITSDDDYGSLSQKLEIIQQIDAYVSGRRPASELPVSKYIHDFL
jgi:hypothetical protein